MSAEPESLRALFESAKAQKKSLESDSPISNPSYQDKLNATISTFERCQAVVSGLSIFSSNESLEEVSTADLQYGLPS
jgi:hypothetical protein